MFGIADRLPFIPVNIAVLTVSDTRNEDTDESGKTLATKAKDAGHIVIEKAIVKDDENLIAKKLQQWIDSPQVEVILATGGTGVTGRDVTPEAFRRVIEKEIPGFGELFRWLSFRTIGTSTIQSRAMAGVANGTYLFALPGSRSACIQAWDEIFQYQLDARHRPCNFVELLPRLRETVSV